MRPITKVVATGLCGIFVVRGLCFHRALHRCVLQETAPRPGFGFSALPVLHYGFLLLFLGLGFPLLPIHSIYDLGSYSHSLYLRVDLWPSEVENLLLLWTSSGQVTRGWPTTECKARWPSRRAPEELNFSELGPIQLKGCPGAVF